MVLYEITHFTPSAVVNCDIIILRVLLNMLVFSYRQIIMLSKYNICINLRFVLYLIPLKNVLLYFVMIVSLYICVCVRVCVAAHIMEVYLPDD